jgi:hypothetical protein
MPELNLENLGPDLHFQLCELAEEEGRSVEELVQSMLRHALEQRHQSHLATKLVNRFSESGLSDEETFEEVKGRQVREPKFDQ